MDEMLLREKRMERMKYIDDRLSQQFTEAVIHGNLFHILPNGVAIMLDAMGGEYDGIVIEFSDNVEEAKKYNSEDGTLYRMDEYGPEEMYQEMIREIENEM